MSIVRARGRDERTTSVTPRGEKLMSTEAIQLAVRTSEAMPDAADLTHDNTHDSNGPRTGSAGHLLPRPG
jgi:hypothetical protein